MFFNRKRAWFKVYSLEFRNSIVRCFVFSKVGGGVWKRIFFVLFCGFYTKFANSKQITFRTLTKWNQSNRTNIKSVKISSWLCRTRLTSGCWKGLFSDQRRKLLCQKMGQYDIRVLENVWFCPSWPQSSVLWYIWDRSQYVKHTSAWRINVVSSCKTKQILA